MMGVGLSQSVSWTIVRCADHFDADLFEDIATKTYGPRMATFTSLIMLLTQLGMLVSNVVLLKTLVPHMAQQLLGRPLPAIISTSQTGQTVWAFIFCFAVIMPLSMPRDLSANRYGNLIALFFIYYFSLTIPYICFTNRELVPSISASVYSAAFQPKMPLLQGVMTSVPLIIFVMMIQQVIPSIYSELQNRSLKTMRKVLIRNYWLVAFLYCLVGFFGYATWVAHNNVHQITQSQNILLAPYDPTFATILPQLAVFSVTVV